MPDSKIRSLRVFLCHASSDKFEVHKLYSRLMRDGFDAWLDKEKLIPGQNWQIEIPKVVRNSDVVLVCLSSRSVNKEGFVQKEIKIALDAADEKPEGTIFIIPVRLENCNMPERIGQFHWVDLFSDNGYERLLKALQIRADTVGATLNKTPKVNAKKDVKPSTPKVKNKLEKVKSAEESQYKRENVIRKNNKGFTATSWIAMGFGFLSFLSYLGILSIIPVEAFWLAIGGFLIFAIETIAKYKKISPIAWIAMGLGFLGFLSFLGIFSIIPLEAFWLVIIGFILFVIETKLRK